MATEKKKQQKERKNQPAKAKKTDKQNDRELASADLNKISGGTRLTDIRDGTSNRR
jgi:hypothetical protein